MSKPVHSADDVKPYHSRLIADTYITRLVVDANAVIIVGRGDEWQWCSQQWRPPFTVIYCCHGTVLYCPIFYQWLVDYLPCDQAMCQHGKNIYDTHHDETWTERIPTPTTPRPRLTPTSWHNSGRPTTSIFIVPGTCHTRECLPRDDSVHVSVVAVHFQASTLPPDISCGRASDS